MAKQTVFVTVRLEVPAEEVAALLDNDAAQLCGWIHAGQAVRIDNERGVLATNGFPAVP